MRVPNMDHLPPDKISPKKSWKNSSKTIKEKTKKKRKPTVYLTDSEYKASKRNINEQCKFESYCKRLEQEVEIQDRNNQQSITILCSKDEERKRHLGVSHRKLKNKQCMINVDCCAKSFIMSKDNRSKLSSPTLTCCGICKGTQNTVHVYEEQKSQLDILTTGTSNDEGTSICLFSSDKDLEMFMELMEKELEKLNKTRKDHEMSVHNYIGKSGESYDKDVTEHSFHNETNSFPYYAISNSEPENDALTRVHSMKHSDTVLKPIPPKQRRRIRPQSSPLKSHSASGPAALTPIKTDSHLFYPTMDDFKSKNRMREPYPILPSTLTSGNEIPADKSTAMIREAMEKLDLNKDVTVYTKILNSLRQKGYTHIEQLASQSRR